MPRLTVTEVAVRVGVHKSTVSRQANAAGLVGSDRLIDLDAYVALRAQSIDPALQTTGTTAARIRPAAAPAPLNPADSAPIPGPAEPLPDAIAVERLRRMRLDNEAAEEARRIRRGELVEAAHIAAETEEAFRRVRDLLLDLPRDVAEDCARLGDATAIEALLRQALKTRLREAAETLATEAELVVAA